MGLRAATSSPAGPHWSIQQYSNQPIPTSTRSLTCTATHDASTNLCAQFSHTLNTLPGIINVGRGIPHANTQQAYGMVFVPCTPTPPSPDTHMTIWISPGCRYSRSHFNHTRTSATPIHTSPPHPFMMSTLHPHLSTSNRTFFWLHTTSKTLTVIFSTGRPTMQSVPSGLSSAIWAS